MIFSRIETKKRGFIMLTTILLVALLTALGTYLFQRSMVHVPYMSTMVNREKARILALSGIDIAIGQLIEPVEDEKKETQQEVGTKQQSKQQSADDAIGFAKRIIPLLNQWQIFTLKEKVDGVDAELSIMIMCEEGKLPINELYDFKKHTFKNVGKPQGDTQKMLQDICVRIQKISGGNNSFESLATFLKNRKEPLDDVTELLLVPEFKYFKYAIFPEFSKKITQQDGRSVQKSSAKKIFLTDLFTISSGTSLVQPWGFSPSLQELFGLIPSIEFATKQQKEKVENALKNFKKKMTWPGDWKASLGVLYGKDFTSLPNSIQSMLDTTFEPMTFSVVIHSSVNGVSQRLFSLVERQKVATKSKKRSYIGKMKRIYWF